MKLRTHRHVRYTIKIDDDDKDKELEIEHEPCDAPMVKKLDDGCTVVGYLSHDPDPSNPRENDSLGTMVCWHKRYSLGGGGDEHRHAEINDLWRHLLGDDYERIDQEACDELNAWHQQHPQYRFGSPESQRIRHAVSRKLQQQIQTFLEERFVILPLYLYDHSGITMSTSSGRFHICDSHGWDWGMVGFIYVSKEDVLKTWSVKDWDDPVYYKHCNTTKTARQRARDALVAEVDEYDHYLTGACYGVCVEVFGQDGQKFNDHACWGFLGRKYATQSLQEEVENTIKHLTKENHPHE